MSSVSYQFATRTQTSWLHSVTCDGCKTTVTREGPMPEREGEEVPMFVPGALRGWGSFSMRATRPPADNPALPEDEWPDLHRDLCPSCLNVVHDILCDMGFVPGERTDLYLDAMGRPCDKPKSWHGPGEVLCSELCGVGAETRCWGPVDHAPGNHQTIAAPEQLSKWLCPICESHAGNDPSWHRVIFTMLELEAHAVAEHWVRHFSEGWSSDYEDPCVYYQDVRTALHAEQRLLETAREQEQVAQRQQTDGDFLRPWWPYR